MSSTRVFEVHICQSADDAVSANRQGLQGEVHASAKCPEAAALRGRHDPRQLSGIAAGQLHAGDIRMAGQLDDGVRAEIKPAADSGEVVDEHREGGLISYARKCSMMSPVDRRLP